MTTTPSRKKIFVWGKKRKLMIKERIEVPKRSYKDCGFRFYNRGCYSMPYSVCDKRSLEPLKDWLYGIMGREGVFYIFTWRLYRWKKIIVKKKKIINGRVVESKFTKYRWKPKPYMLAEVHLVVKEGKCEAYWMRKERLLKQKWWKENCR